MIAIHRSMSKIMIVVGALAPMMCAAGQARGGETVFVMSNNAEGNQVIAFERLDDGSFAERHRYDTEGRGSGGVNDPLESQGSLTLSTDHSLLFAANAGSGDITVFRVDGDGLQFAGIQPSGGSEPVSIAQWQDRVYVLNSGGAGSVVGFGLDRNGELRTIANSTAFLSANATGGASISISPNGQALAVVERIANNIDTFNINADGTLGPIVVNPSPGAGAFSARFAPDGALLVSETGPAGAANGSAISSYKVLADGTLSAISQSVPTDGSANCWNAISPDGTRVYASNAGSSSIAGFTIGTGGTLSPLAGTIVGSNPAGSTNLDIAISGDGQFLFSLNGETGTVGVFTINPDGSLTELQQAPGLPKAAGFNGIAAL